jgi:hypothetical protein
MKRVVATCQAASHCTCSYWSDLFRVGFGNIFSLLMAVSLPNGLWEQFVCLVPFFVSLQCSCIFWLNTHIRLHTNQPLGSCHLLDNFVKVSLSLWVLSSLITLSS